MNKRTVAEGKAVLGLRADGIMHLEWKPGVDVLTEDARAAVTAINDLSADRDRPLLVDMRNVGSMSAGARQVFSVPHAASVIALVGESHVDRVIANFFIGVRRPERPTRFFTSEKDAVAWLLREDPARAEAEVRPG